jgi:hypothetical protein
VLLPAKPLRGRAAELAAAIERRLSTGATEIAKPRLCQELGVDRRDYADLIKRPALVDWLDANRLAVRRLRGNVTGLRGAA